MAQAAAQMTQDDDFDYNAHFNSDLKTQDRQIFDLIGEEWQRQSDVIELIASENLVSRALLQAQGSQLTNKYAEGYPGKRYYGGCEIVDKVEQLAIDRACQLFNAKFANVQPHCGSSANQAVYFACLQPGDTALAMDLNHGGHLTHGSPVNQSGKWFNVIPYGLGENGEINYAEVERLALEHKPKLIIGGATVYSRVIDWAFFRKVADEIGAVFMADVAHYAGLIAGGVYPNALPHAHVMTTTTHKTLRGPRAGMVLTNDEEMAKKINRAIFPGLQGGPLEHIIAAKAVCLGEALRPEFKQYARKVVDNARMLCTTLARRGYDCISGGTDSHVMLMTLVRHGMTGKDAETSLVRARLNCNRNSVPNDPQKPMVTSGIRLGSPAGTTRGFGTAEYEIIGNLISDVLDGLKANGVEGNGAVEDQVRAKVKELCSRFPIYEAAFA